VPLVASLALSVLPARAQTSAFELGLAGCSMAHCGPHLADAVNLISPPSARLAAIDAGTLNHASGVGCSSNSTVVACTTGVGSGQAGYLVVYDGDGNRLWTDGGLLGSTALASAPLVGTDNTVIAADQNAILRVDPFTHRVLWQSTKPDGGIPISPVPVGADMVLLATDVAANAGNPEVSVWDAASGDLLAHQALIDPTTGAVYATRNTPAVSGNRVYISTAAVNNSADGRLYAIDVCSAAPCARGALSVAWYYAFTGPSGASPLVIGSRIFFDGQPHAGQGMFMAVDDHGDAGTLTWGRTFRGQFVANAAQDARRGLWVYPYQSPALLRLDPATGGTLQQVNLSSAMGLPSGYTPNTCVTVSSAASGASVLTFGTRNASQPSLPTYVAAVDVSSSSAGLALWAYQVAGNAATNEASGQFPVVVSPSTGSHRVVFLGTNSSTFFVGGP
jgi:hypothetical protein